MDKEVLVYVIRQLRQELLRWLAWLYHFAIGERGKVNHAPIQTDNRC